MNTRLRAKFHLSTYRRIFPLVFEFADALVGNILGGHGDLFFFPFF